MTKFRVEIGETLNRSSTYLVEAESEDSLTAEFVVKHGELIEEWEDQLSGYILEDVNEAD